MPRNGYGLEVLPAGNPVITNDVLTADLWNNTMNDLAQGLTNSLTADGQKVASSNQPMGGYRHTGCGDAVGATEYVTLGQAPRVIRPVNVVTSGVWQTLTLPASLITTTKLNQFTVEVENSNSFWSTSNNKFTPTAAGWYYVQSKLHAIIPHPAGNYVTLYISIYKNGAEALTGDRRATWTPDSQASFSVSGLIKFNGTTDYVEVYCSGYHGNPTQVLVDITSSAPYTSFHSFLIGGY